MFRKTFKKNRNIIIGAIHLPPLSGYPNALPVETAIKNALKDLYALEKGGADAVIFENNYDLPHKIKISRVAFAEMLEVGKRLREKTSLPIGVSVLWNDFESAFSLAKSLKLQFIRVPVFVDDVKTAYGKVTAAARKVRSFRKKIRAQNVMVLADIHVKHAEILSKHSIEESAQKAIKKGADAIIITGKWTGQAPDTKDLENVRKTVKDFPILIGSGADATNVRDLFQYANGAIVSTSLKKGRGDSQLTNIKDYDQRIDVSKVRQFKNSLN